MDKVRRKNILGLCLIVLLEQAGICASQSHELASPRNGDLSFTIGNLTINLVPIITFLLLLYLIRLALLIKGEDTSGSGSGYGSDSSSGYGAPSSNYGAPSSNYGAPAPSYGAPAPSSNYGAPAPSSNYGSPAVSSGYSGGSAGYGLRSSAGHEDDIDEDEGIQVKQPISVSNNHLTANTGFNNPLLLQQQQQQQQQQTYNGISREDILKFALADLMSANRQEGNSETTFLARSLEPRKRPKRSDGTRK